MYYFTKASVRTSRSACKCGSTDYYWFDLKDSDQRIRVDADDDTRALEKGRRISDAHLDAHVHECDREKFYALVNPPESEPPAWLQPPGWNVNPPADKDDSLVYEDYQPPTIVDPPKVDGLQALRDLLGPSVTPEQIRQMVDDALSARQVPTVTVVVKDDVAKPVEGLTHHILGSVVRAVGAGLNVLMVGPAGTGKSTIARQVADSLGDQFYEVSLDPGMTASQMFGYMDAQGNYVRTVFRDAFEHGGIFHCDEFDNGHPSILAKMNAALALSEGQTMAFPDGMVAKGNVRFIASANTFGMGPDRVYVGRNQLDGATLDRFITIEVDYDEALETAACDATGLDAQSVIRILTYVRGLRYAARDHKLPLIFGQRSSIMACKLRLADASWIQVQEYAIRRGVSDKDWLTLGGAAI